VLFSFSCVKNEPPKAIAPADDEQPLMIAHLDVEADTLVRSGRDADLNFGAALELETDGDDDGEVLEAYLRFFVPAVTIETAIVRVFVANGSEPGVDVRAFTDDAWQEMFVTWNNKPPIDGRMIAQLEKIDEDGYLDVDVTASARDLSTLGGKLSIAFLARAGDGFAIHSRENGSGRRPQLVLAYRGPLIPPAPPPPPPPDVADSGVPASPKPDAGLVLEDAAVPGQPDASTPLPGSEVILVGAGDIADCDSSGDEATALLLDQIVANHAGAVIFTTGDNVYDDGTPEEFSDCYEPSWGRHKAITRPAAGNHDYHTDGASGYFEYFGANAGDPAKGYYSYDHGAWHIVVLSSNCGDINGCDVGSAQEQWLRNDLASSGALCTLAYWHHPRFSSGDHGDSEFMQPLWQALYDAGADVVLTGHDHNYERFVPLNGAGDPDPARGITSIVVGTGGRELRSLTTRPISAAGDDTSWGVLKMTLKSGSADFVFIPAAGNSFTDSGTIVCH
jgi:acid phosphatase type 7